MQSSGWDGDLYSISPLLRIQRPALPSPTANMSTCIVHYAFYPGIGMCKLPLPQIYRLTIVRKWTYVYARDVVYYNEGKSWQEL